MVSFMTLAFVNLDISWGGGIRPPPAQLTPQKPGMNRVKWTRQIFLFVTFIDNVIYTLIDYVD